MERKSKKKTIVFSLLVETVLLLTTMLSAQAQSRTGGLFGDPVFSSSSSDGLMGGTSYGATLNTQDFGTTPNTGITVEDFNAPVGVGMLILLTAGAGYAVLRRRKNNE